MWKRGNQMDKVKSSESRGDNSIEDIKLLRIEKQIGSKCMDIEQCRKDEVLKRYNKKHILISRGVKLEMKIEKEEGRR